MKALLLFLAALVLVGVGTGVMGSRFGAGSSPPAAAVPAADREAVVRGNNQAALDVYARLGRQPGNLFFSPYSISTALAMTYAGARGETATEMAHALHFSLDNDRLHAALADLVRRLNGEGKKRGYQLSSANALWGQKGYPFLPTFLRLVTDHYGAGLREVDFARATEEARRAINAWVEKETHDKIKDLIQQGLLDGSTRLVLTNAIYFKGNWDAQFPKGQTREGEFHGSAGKNVKAPLMHRTGDYAYADAGNFQVLELPYVGQDLGMVVLLPRKVDGLADLEKTLTAERLAGWLAKLREEEVDVTLPRFKMTREFELSKVLADMGMPLAFSDRADFSGMDGKSGSLYLSAVVHKAFVEVNEEGTEAAAATGAVVKLALEKMKPAFRADHPFLFLIRDRHTGAILFLGRMTNPG